MKIAVINLPRTKSTLLCEILSKKYDLVNYEEVLNHKSYNDKRSLNNFYILDNKGKPIIYSLNNIGYSIQYVDEYYDINGHLEHNFNFLKNTDNFVIHIGYNSFRSYPKHIHHYILENFIIYLSFRKNVVDQIKSLLISETTGIWNIKKNFIISNIIIDLQNNYDIIERFIKRIKEFIKFSNNYNLQNIYYEDIPDTDEFSYRKLKYENIKFENEHIIYELLNKYSIPNYIEDIRKLSIE